MNRVILIVLDGCGVGAMPDAALYGVSDPQSATLPHVAEAIGGLHLPTLQALGLGNIVPIRGISPVHASGGWGRLAEVSAGKDSVMGHWELMGIVTETARKEAADQRPFHHTPGRPDDPSAFSGTGENLCPVRSDRQKYLPACPPPLVCHTPAVRRGRSAGNSGDAGPCQCPDDSAVYARGCRPSARSL